MKRATTVIKEFGKRFPGVKGLMDASEWSGRYAKGEAIHMGDAAEGGTITMKESDEIFEVAAINYYSECYDVYEFGVHKDIVAFMEKRGFSIEAYDPGTYIAYRN